MAKFLIINRKRFAIRGPWSVAELREQYAQFCSKFHNDPRVYRFDRWLAERGKVYFSVKD